MALAGTGKGLYFLDFYAKHHSAALLPIGRGSVPILEARSSARQ